MTVDSHPRVLFDARSGGALTGIGRYTHELTRQYAELAATRVRPVCWRAQRSHLRALGFRPCLSILGRVDHGWLLPRVDVTHRPSFKPLVVRGTRSVITVHDLAWRRLPDHYPESVRHELDQDVAAAADSGVLAVCDSESARQDLIDFFRYPPERTRTIHLGVDPIYGEASASDARATAVLGLNGRYLLHVGAWVPRKDIPTLLAAWALVAEDDAELELVLVGGHADGWMSDRPRIEAWLAAHPLLAPRVKTLGHVREEHLPAITRRAEALVSSSRWEGFGLTILQSLIGGVPVAAARNSSLPEVGGEFVQYATTGDPVSLAEAIVRALATSAEERSAAMAHARGFSWRRCAEATLASYASA